VGSGSATDEVKHAFDDWGNLTKLEQDHNGLVGGTADDYEVGYTIAKNAPSNARSTLRRTEQLVVYNATTEQDVDYDYDTASGINDSLSRLYAQKISGTSIATYSYNGEAELMEQKLSVPKLATSMDSLSSMQTYPNIDRFNRVTTSSWWNTNASGTEQYDTDVTYDESSNILLAEDNIQKDPGAGGNGVGTIHAFDAKYTIDGLNRVTQAEEGDWTGSSIATKYRDEQWTLTQTGNWDRNKVNFNGDADFTDAGELDDTRAHAPVNEILTRNTNSTGGVEFTLTYNLRGDLEDEGGTGGYKYVWDAFGRLVTVNRQNKTLLAEYRYNGLNQRITWHYDATGNGTTDGSDPTYHFAWGGDEKWRMVGTWRGFTPAAA